MKVVEIVDSLAYEDKPDYEYVHNLIPISTTLPFLELSKKLIPPSVRVGRDTQNLPNCLVFTIKPWNFVCGRMVERLIHPRPPP